MGQILFEVSPGTVLGPILFNIFLSVLFLILNDTDIVSYTDDNNLYKACDKVGNTSKCYLMLSIGDSNQIQIENSFIAVSVV